MKLEPFRRDDKRRLIEALAKRELERKLRALGCSRKEACRIVSGASKQR